MGHFSAAKGHGGGGGCVGVGSPADENCDLRLQRRLRRSSLILNSNTHRKGKRLRSESAADQNRCDDDPQSKAIENKIAEETLVPYKNDLVKNLIIIDDEDEDGEIENSWRGQKCADRKYQGQDSNLKKSNEYDDDEIMIISTKEDPNGVYKFDITLIDLEDKNLSKGGSSESEFKKELLDILRCPYDPQQHKALWDEVVTHKKSYLDLYKDFADQIIQAKADDRKTLNLLRGFFYWLKNLPHGMIAPWKDPSFSEALSQP
ncbi:uncharacterized protein LOC115698710 [Cannabis sativa]|uniref:Uncharacterized protein n=2 Tax=Cannabis sativa TaxID=3483 RepID=A0AB40E8E2_CANSA|nr:uncharacterized protein LOC115698710 [Cannabis sativa]KAF4373086.1 hypothetical protein F8388_019268 [Cannabis sativa]KAF4388361.1 hypothetical protein G4B88_013198 [Cannabis sativa]